MNGLSSQRGMGLTGYLLLIICVVFFGKVGIATIPSYIQSNSIKSIIQKQLDKAGNKTGKQVVEAIRKEVSVNYSGFNIDDKLTVTNGAPGYIKLKLAYAEENNFFGTTYLVNKIEQDFTQ